MFLHLQLVDKKYYALLIQFSTMSNEPTTWCHAGTDHKKGKEDDIVVATDSEVMIERDRLILSKIKNIAKVSMQAKYCVIGVYDKSYNKWFMAKENKKHWMLLSHQERKK